MQICMPYLEWVPQKVGRLLLPILVRINGIYILRIVFIIIKTPSEYTNRGSVQLRTES